MSIIYFLPIIIISIGLIIYFSISDIKYGFITFLILIIAYIILFKLSQKCTNDYKTNEKIENHFYDEIYDALNNSDSILTSNMVNFEMNKINNESKNLSQYIIKSESCTSKLKFIFLVIYFIIMIILNGLAIKLFFDNKISKGTMVSIFFIVLTLIQYYDSASYELKNLINHVGKYRELTNYFDNFNLTNNSFKNNFKIKKGDIIFKNIGLNYNKIIFDKFNLTLKGQTKIGIFGEIGSGKTSLLKMLINLKQYEGNILIDGQNLKDFDSETIINHISYVPQNSKLFKRTIHDNLVYGTNYDLKKLENKLKQLNLNYFINQFKNGLKTNVGRNGDNISGGQKQIIYILRVIFQDKPILLMDEPTSSFDTYYKSIIINLLKVIKNKTLIIVTHDNDLIPIFDRIITLKNGKVIKDIIKN